MQKAKVALVEAGIIKSAGRGRISADGHAWLQARYEEGVRFSDWPKGKVEVTESEAEDKTVKTTVKVVRDSTQSNANTVAELAPYRYPEEDFKAVETVGGKERSLRSACNGCGYSLVVCWCHEPRIASLDGSTSVKVTIKRK